MVGSIDRFGRVVIPKSLRDLLGLAPGTALSISQEGGAIQISPLSQESAVVQLASGRLALSGELVGELADPVAADREAHIRHTLGLE